MSNELNNKHHADDVDATRGVDAPTELPETDPAPSPMDVAPKRRGAFIFIFLTVSLDMLAFGMIAPVLPHLIRDFMGGSASRTAEMIGLFGTLFAVMQFFFSPVLGSLSDRFGRRPVVLLSNFGLGLDYVLMALAPSVSWLFVGRAISGITASSIPTAQAYMADVTPKEKRAAAFGMLQSAFGFGFIVGPALGGWLATFSPRAPFWVSAGLSLLNGIYGLFVLPESLAKENRSPFRWKRANPVGSVRMLTRSRKTIVMSIVLLTGYIAQNSLMSVWVLSAQVRFGWTDRAVGLSLAAIGVVTIIYGLLLVRRTSKWIGDRMSVVLGLFGGSLGYAMFAAAATGGWFLAGIPLMNLTSVAWPSSQAILTRSAAANEQGQMQGAINSLRGIGGIVGPGLFTVLFAKAFGDWSGLHLPGLPFYFASALILVGAVLALFVREPEVAA